MENAPIPHTNKNQKANTQKKPAARYPRAGRFSTYVRRLSFGSYAISSSAISSSAVSYEAVSSSAVSYEAISSEAVSTFSASSSVTARSERDSCESYEHEN